MKRNLILIFCVLILLSWYVAFSETINNPKKVEEHLARAAELESQGIFVDAIAEYEEALKYQPGDVEISLKMAGAYLQTGNSKKYISICKSTAEANQEDSSALECLMDYYMEKGNKASALKYLSEFTEKYPDNETAQRWMMQLKGSYQELYCRYDELSAVYRGSMVVGQADRYGVTDSLGSEILEVEYEEANPFSKDGLALVLKDGRYIYVDEDGQTRLVADAAYTDLGLMSSGRTVAAVDGKFGYLDEKLQPVTEFLWDKLTLISDSIGACRLDGKWALINKSGAVKTDYIYEDVIVDENGFCSKQSRIFVKEAGSYHMIDKKGKPVGELVFEDARCFSEEGNAAVCRSGKWGFVDTSGELVIDYQFDDAQSFQNGFAAVCVDGRWGYVDESGCLVIEPQFEIATAISEKGTVAVKLERWRLIQLEIFR